MTILKSNYFLKVFINSLYMIMTMINCLTHRQLKKMNLQSFRHLSFFRKAMCKKSLNLINPSDSSSQQLNTKVCYCFSNKPTPSKKNISWELKQKIEIEQKHEQQNKPDLNSYLKDMQSMGWRVVKQGTQLQAIKSIKNHKLTLQATIKPPLKFPQSEKQRQIDVRRLQIETFREEIQRNPELKKNKQLKEMLKVNPVEEFDEDMCQVTLFVEKKPTSTPSDKIRNWKILCIEYLVNSKIAQINQICFLDQMQASRFRRELDPQQYLGRVLANVDFQILELLSMHLTSEWQIQNYILSTFSQLTLSYENEEYRQWLEDIKQLI